MKCFVWIFLLKIYGRQYIQWSFQQTTQEYFSVVKLETYFIKCIIFIFANFKDDTLFIPFFKSNAFVYFLSSKMVWKDQNYIIHTFCFLCIWYMAAFHQPMSISKKFRLLHSSNTYIFQAILSWIHNCSNKTWFLGEVYKCKSYFILYFEGNHDLLWEKTWTYTDLIN